MVQPDTASTQPAIPRFRLALATGAGIGYIPVAPGTFGSMLGLALYQILYTLGGSLSVLVAIPLVTFSGIWAANAAERHFRCKDPGQVVIDEIAGQLIALLFVVPSSATLVCGFLLFRIFDILKPFPAGRLEKRPGGTGIMLDDLVAGLYANLVLQLLLWFLPGLAGVQ